MTVCKPAPGVTQSIVDECLVQPGFSRRDIRPYELQAGQVQAITKTGAAPLRRREMDRLIAAVLISLAAVGAAHAATVTNAGDTAIVLIVVENGNRMEVPLEPGATEDICSAGCFVTLPNGDRLPLTGGEAVDISNGTAVVK